MSSLARIAVVGIVFTSSPAFAAEDHPRGKASAAPSAAEQERCAQHGVQRSLCARCNPKLAAVFRAKGDWCAEHERPESQCVLCHPELAKKGIK